MKRDITKEYPTQLVFWGVIIILVSLIPFKSKNMDELHADSHFEEIQRRPSNDISVTVFYGIRVDKSKIASLLHYLSDSFPFSDAVGFSVSPYG